MQPSEFSTYGAVDLGARKAALEREAQRQAAAEAGNTNPYAVDVTEENFQREVLERSLQVPVVLVLLAGWSGESKQTEQALDKLVAESQGQWLLAKIDTGVSPQLTQALRAQAVPALYLALGGQIQPIAVGAINENQARDLLTQVFSALRQQGVLPQNFTGVGPAQPAEQQPKHNPVQAKAAEAVQRGDFAAAEAAYTEALEKDPRNADYTMGLAQVRLLARVRDLDVKRSASRRPTIPLTWQPSARSPTSTCTPETSRTLSTGWWQPSAGPVTTIGTGRASTCSACSRCFRQETRGLPRRGAI